MGSKILFLIVFLLAFSGCEDIINSVVECSIKDVKLENKTLRIGTVGRNYYETISANVKNDPNDDYYMYDFFITGKLQKGLQFYTEGNKFVINGVPEEAGTIGFVLTVEVTLDDEALGLCRETAKRSYELTVK
jgi:hypothetical protein